MSEFTNQSLSCDTPLPNAMVEPKGNHYDDGDDGNDVVEANESNNDSVNHSEKDRSVSGNSGTRSGADDDVDSISKQIAHKETRNVFRLRIIIVLILVFVAAGVTIGVYFIMRGAEDSEFQIQFEAAGEKIIESFQQILVSVTSVSALAIAASAHSVDHNSEWPFVTISNFQQRARNVLESSGAIQVSVNPIVHDELLSSWETFVVEEENNVWMDEGLDYQEQLGINDYEDEGNIEKSFLTEQKVDPLHSIAGNGEPFIDPSKGPFLPQWQMSPVLQSSAVNENLFSQRGFVECSKQAIEKGAVVLGGFVTAPMGFANHSNHETSIFATLQSMAEGNETKYLGDPMAYFAVPIFDTFDVTSRRVVAVLKSTIHWRSYFFDILPSNVRAITVVLENGCDGFFTYEIDGSDAYPVGMGDLHNGAFEGMTGKFAMESIEDGTLYGLRLNQDGCPYFIHVYPTDAYYNSFHGSDPLIVAVSLGVVFALTIAVFFLYDWLVERRQSTVLAQATQSTAIVSSLFPRKVRDRLMKEQNEKLNARKGSQIVGQNRRIKTFLNTDCSDIGDTKPIADLFPDCTVFFGDISGFTAWSSEREPAQVFLLLQSIYGAFDRIAKRLNVFKVETIGDSYVAVTGLPDSQPDHAVRMVRFASECLLKIGQVTRELEVEFGPDTGNLSMRFGLHSGPVTAGVLKGDRARFQLFGDTVNTASRMESTGKSGKIQVSQSTADLLVAAGKGIWISERVDAVEAKGKGIVKTYWVDLGRTKTPGASASANGSGGGDQDNIADLSALEVPLRGLTLEQDRRIEWIVSLLAGHIKSIVAVRASTEAHSSLVAGSRSPGNDAVFYHNPHGTVCLDEVQDSIKILPKFCTKTIALLNDPDYINSIELGSEVMNDLRAYVTLIASSYNDNSFHNFEHACHVTMSVNKLLHRIVTPSLQEDSVDKTEVIHNFTHGICGDPLAVFAIIFSALIHDADHQGIPNAQLIKEEPEVGALYRNKSVAEQNSLDVSWGILMEDQFLALRRFIFGNQKELLRFRQLLVNVVLATDIFDKEANDLRRDRWERAFHPTVDSSSQEVRDLRATVVIEHIIQASDVCHCMQHWHIYTKWNKKLFFESYSAFSKGRIDTDPTALWYEGEISFFDNYVMPLARKLQECNVFGACSDDYLNYAKSNRAEWEEKGKSIVEGYKAIIANREKGSAVAARSEGLPWEEGSRENSAQCQSAASTVMISENSESEGSSRN